MYTIRFYSLLLLVMCVAFFFCLPAQAVSSQFSVIAPGAAYTLGLKADGSLWGWGTDYGKAPWEVSKTPVEIYPGESFTAIAAGDNHFLAIKTDGSLWGWGTGALLGSECVSWAKMTKLGDDFMAVACGVAHAVAIKIDGSLWFWGADQFQALAMHSFSIEGNFVKVSTRGFHTLALDSDGNVWAWGTNTRGEIGNGTTAYQATPMIVGQDFIDIAAGYSHSMGIKQDGSLWVWGGGLYGQLGNGETENLLTAVKILDSVKAIAATTDNSFAVKSDGTLLAWGMKGPAMGDGIGDTQCNSPIIIGSGYQSASGGWGYVYAEKDDKTLMAWGNNSLYELGNGTKENILTPTRAFTSPQNMIPVIHLLLGASQP